MSHRERAIDQLCSELQCVARDHDTFHLCRQTCLTRIEHARNVEAWFVHYRFDTAISH